MPIGIQRLNARKSHPNDRIIFIKPLKGPGEKIAQDFLERIAAQCSELFDLEGQLVTWADRLLSADHERKPPLGDVTGGV